ncbi:MAG TPA: DNA polymerase/3'-5' exonuclease PolX [Desulfuromonadales bacterium]|nr:DNA polymerase/3'-5' exonuclease PolX [Desulfuromonadales bacterium]
MKRVDKQTVSHILEEIGLLLELKGENPFKSRAYRRAARTIRTLPGNLAERVAAGTLDEAPGIGAALSEKITELVETGTLAYHTELLVSFPPGFSELLTIAGLGPKKAKILYDALGIASVGELEYACQENRLADLPGFGAKTQEKLLEGIARRRRYQGRFLFPEALEIAEGIRADLAKHPAVSRVAVAGSLRRCLETVTDADLVAAVSDAETAGAALTGRPEVARIIEQGPTKTAVQLEGGLQIDLRCVDETVYPFALLHFTGSKEHNAALRARARRLGLTLNEYGLFKGNKSLPCRDEKEIYAALGLAFIAPELREDRGEIAAAEAGELPDLVSPEELRGVFHVHTVASDGTATLEELTAAAAERGWQYLGICDHSRSAHYAHGLEVERVRRQWQEIDALNEAGGVRLFKGIETDILADGALDYPDEVLAGFDFVVASIHSYFQLPEAEQTARLLRALENPYTTILGHLTGRLLLARDGYAVDLEAVIAAAVRRKVVLELNANPHRLDLDWRLLKQARDAGVMIAINPDAHDLKGLDDVRYGVGVARKGWLSAGDILNTRSAAEVADWFGRRRS